MGMSPFKRSCYSTGGGTAPNPNPKRWKLLDYEVFPNAVVLLVRYVDCTNFEGKKVIVYHSSSAEKIKLLIKNKKFSTSFLDPHFRKRGLSPIARFAPTIEGVQLALTLAESL